MLTTSVCLLLVAGVFLYLIRPHKRSWAGWLAALPPLGVTVWQLAAVLAGLKRGDPRRAVRLGRVAGAHPRLSARRPRLAVWPDYHRHRRGGRPVHAQLSGGRQSARVLLPLPLLLHGFDAGARLGRQSAHAVRVLGGDERHQLPPDRIFAHLGRVQGRRAQRLHRHRRRRAGLARRHDPAWAGERKLHDQRDRQSAGSERAAGISVLSGADPVGRVHQVGPVPVPLVAPRGDGRAHARQRLSAFGHHGESGRLSAGAPSSRAERPPHVDVVAGHHWRRDHAGRRDRRHAPGGHKGLVGLRPP